MLQPTHAPPLPSPPPAPAHHEVRRVLVLDDDPALLRLMGRSLRAPGVTIVTCREIEAAQALLAHSRFDVLLTDLEVSRLGGLEGMRLVQQAAGDLKGTRVIAFSGHGANPHVKTLGAELGASLVLGKPLSMN